MGRTNVNSAVSHHIPSVDITYMRTKKSIDRNGKYVLKIDDSWQFATSDINDGFKKYISDPSNPEKNGIDKKGKATKTLNFKKNDYDFDGILDYSLDLQHLIDYCDSKRIKKNYIFSSKSKNYCLAFVKVNFERNTKDIREYLYRPEGFTITYSIKDKKPVTIQYVRYKRTASGAREGSCLFIAKTLYEEMINWSCAGINSKEAKEIDAVSWEAYVSLTLSAIETTINLNPREILFVEDKEALVKGKAYEITSVKGKLTVNNIIYAKNNESAIKNTNTIWDGEGLIDDSLFNENPVLADQYSDKCMLLLRGKFFKACVFRTHIQKWFSDNGVTDIKQLNGYTQAKNISDIKFIIPYSCLKFIKFKSDKKEQEAIKNWITNIAGKRTVPVFGIIKSDKKSKLMNGEKVFTTYQMLNTLGFNEKTAYAFLEETKNTMLGLCMPGTEGAINVKNYIDNIYFTPTNDQDDYGEESSSFNDTFKSFHYKELTASKLLEYNLDYYNTAHYKEVVNSLLGHIKTQVMNGRVMIDGVYAYLFCNGIELLKYSIDKKYNPSDDVNNKATLRNTEIYSKMFNNKTELLCARNPHITMGNYYLATNKHLKIYDEYFVLSNEIVCVNAINSDIMNILNGCDFDSDTMLITNNSIMVDLLKQMLTIHEQSNKFRVPYNHVKPMSIKKDISDESVFLSNVDDKLSNNQIGSIVNLSQRLNSLIWMLAPLDVQNKIYWNKWNADIGKMYREGCCTLAVLSNIEIDSAKRSYECKTKAEIRRVKNLLIEEDLEKLENYTSWLTNKSNYTPELNEGDKIKGHDIVGLDPMGYIIKSIIDAEGKAKDILSKQPKRSSNSNYIFMKSILKKCNIKDDHSNCEESLNRCLRELVKCNKYLKNQNTKSTENYYKRDYTKDCAAISKCFSIVNQTLKKDTVCSHALLWKLIEIMNDTSRIITTGSEKEVSYFVVGNGEYKQAAEENKCDCPRLLLWGALFVSASDEETYLINLLNKESSLE